MPTDLNQSFRIDPADLPAEAVIFGCTPAMREIRSQIDGILSSALPVLIQGKSGTGKDLVARFLHTRSDRHEAPFVKLNCAAIPANLLESELFGCRTDSHTGAREDRPGWIETAGGGTLFLDEVGDLSWDLQGKLLRLLQDGSYTRSGRREERFGRIRVICATNFDLQELVNKGSFREDLYYRIKVVTLRLPALRERKNDIPQLCEYFLQKLSRQFRRSAPQLNPATLHLLRQWDWPGNLYELENWVARAIIFGDDEALGAELRRQVEMANVSAGLQPRLGFFKDVPRRTTSTASSAAVLKALQANHWDRRKTAAELNMSYRSLLYKLREAGLPQRSRGHRGLPPAH